MDIFEHRVKLRVIGSLKREYGVKGRTWKVYEARGL
jgi:hypothetical protein